MRPTLPFRENRLLFAILIPVVLSGTLVSVFAIWYLTPPLTAILRSRTDATLTHAAEMAISICEERFNGLLELRMENNPEMNTVYLREAVHEIESISRIHPDIDMLVVRRGTELLGTTMDIEPPRSPVPMFEKADGTIQESTFNGQPVRLVVQYFPYWRLHIVSLISEAQYMAPIILARRIVIFGTLGVLLVVLLTLLLLFVWRVDQPLKKIIKATRDVAGGSLVPAEVHGNDEIAEVARAFNVMVGSLAEDQRKIHGIMAELRDSEEQYRLLTEYALAYIAVVRKNRCLFINERMATSLGGDRNRIMEEDFWQAVHPEDRSRVIDRIAALERGEIREDHLECRIRTDRGETIWVEMQAALILYRETHAVLIHAIDITPRKKEQKEREKLERKLSQAKKMEAIGTLAGGVAHDLNNILSGLVGYPDLLLMDLPEESPLRAPLEAIRTSGQKASEIVQDLLTLARRGVANEEVVNLNKVISDYLDSPEQAGLQKRYPGTALETRLSPELMNIVGSPAHLSKIVMNLVTNAAEANGDGGRVVISTENRHLDQPLKGYELIPAGDYVLVRVEDNGAGIAAEDLEKIFEPFFTKKMMNHSGTGLGMTVVWGTTHDHKGFVDIDSAVGSGTRVSLYFPITRKAGTQRASEPGFKEHVGQGESVLVVDDVHEQRQLLEHILRKLNYEPLTAASGEEALRLLEKQPVDLVILDMIMAPGIDGLETYRRILELHPGQKAVVASGFSETDRVQGALRLGAGAYVKKPFTLKALSQAIREVLDR